MQLLNDMVAAHPVWLWAALGAALLAIETLTGSGWLLWAAASAAVTAAAAALVRVPFAGAVLVFAILTIASTLLARRYLPRSGSAPGGDINDNIARLIGHNGSAVAPFAGRSGRVFVDGKEWAAELETGGGLEAGARIEVTGVNGARLKVRPA